MPDGTYRLVKPAEALDAHKKRTRTYDADNPTWTGPGRKRLRPDRSFHVTLEPEAWPVAYRDQVIFPDDRVMVVMEATLNGPDTAGGELEPVRHVFAIVMPFDLAQLG